MPFPRDGRSVEAAESCDEVSRPRWWRRAGVRAATEGAAGTSESISTAIEEAVELSIGNGRQWSATHEHNESCLKHA